MLSKLTTYEKMKLVEPEYINFGTWLWRGAEEMLHAILVLSGLLIGTLLSLGTLVWCVRDVLQSLLFS